MNESAERQRRRKSERRGKRRYREDGVVLVDKGEKKYAALISALGKPFDKLVRQVTATMRSRRQST